MSDALISRVLKTCGADVVQATGNSAVDVMSQKACTDSFSLLQHTHSISDLTSGTLSVSKGGTGKTSLTSGAILLGNGTNAITTTSVLAQSKGGTGTSNFYEKGSWTPTISSSGSTAPTVSYGYRYATYYRIGNLVFIACHINMSISSAGSNYACIKGLPYACSGSVDKYGLSLIEEFYATNTGDGDPRGYVMQGTTRIDLRGHSGAVATTWSTGSNQYIGYSGCYIKS